MSKDSERLLSAAAVYSKIPARWNRPVPATGRDSPSSFETLRQTHAAIRNALAALGPRGEGEPADRAESPGVTDGCRLIDARFVDANTFGVDGMRKALKALAATAPQPPVGATWVGIARVWLRVHLQVTFAGSLLAVPSHGSPDPEGRRPYALEFFEANALLFDDEAQAAALDELCSCVGTEAVPVARMLYHHPAAGGPWLQKTVRSRFQHNVLRRIVNREPDTFPEPPWLPDDEIPSFD